jgi:hypothetical protein
MKKLTEFLLNLLFVTIILFIVLPFAFASWLVWVFYKSYKVKKGFNNGH